MYWEYKALRASIDNSGELHVIGKRAKSFTRGALQERLHVGGLYFLEKGKLYQIISEEERKEW